MQLITAVYLLNSRVWTLRCEWRGCCGLFLPVHCIACAILSLYVWIPMKMYSLHSSLAEPQPVVPRTAWSFWFCSTYIHMLYIYSVCRIPSTASKSKSSQHFQGDLTATPLRGFHRLVISEWNMPIQVIFIACTSCASWSISNCPCSIPQSAWGYATHTCAVLQIVLDTGLAFWKLRKAIKAPDICQVWPQYSLNWR